MSDAFICDAVRTPVGRYGGGLSKVRTDDHGAQPIKALLDRNDGGVDSAFSIEPHELRALVEEPHRARMGLGDVTYGTARIEQDSLRFRRSIYVTRDLAAGDELTRENVRIIRPG